MRWNDFQLLDYAADLKMDALFLQDSLDPGKDDPAHWRKVKAYAADKGLHLETGDRRSAAEEPDAMETSRQRCSRASSLAAAMGSPIVRCLHAGDRAHLPPGSVDQHIETMIRLLKSVRSQAMDANVKFAIENHKDLQAWEMRQVIEGAGKEFVGSYLDTGNPVFVCENPLTTVEVLGPLCADGPSARFGVYETPQGAAVQWVPLGEGSGRFQEVYRAAAGDRFAGLRVCEADHGPSARNHALSSSRRSGEATRNARARICAISRLGQARPAV